VATRSSDKPETKDLLLSVPIEPKYDQPLKTAARREGRSVAGHIRFLIMRDLQDKDLVDNDLDVIAGEAVGG
jgi:hypothetical protein